MDKNWILDFPFFFLCLQKDIPFFSPSKWVSLSKIYPLFFLLSSSFFFLLFLVVFLPFLSLYLLHLGASLSPPHFLCSLNLNLIIIWSISPSPNPSWKAVIVPFSHTPQSQPSIPSPIQRSTFPLASLAPTSTVRCGPLI